MAAAKAPWRGVTLFDFDGPNGKVRVQINKKEGGTANLDVRRWWLDGDTFRATREGQSVPMHLIVKALAGIDAKSLASTTDSEAEAAFVKLLNGKQAKVKKPKLV